MRKIFFLLAISLLVCLVCINLVTSFGYSYSYTPDNLLTVYPGETKQAQIRLKPSPEDENLTIKAEILDNSSIAELVDKNFEYEIGPGKDATVNITLKIPKNASIGQNYPITIKFSDITPSDKGGTIGLRGGIIVTLNPKVIEKPQEKQALQEGITIIWIILGGLVIIASIVVVYFIIKNIRKPIAD